GRRLTIQDKSYGPDDWISIDGTTGEVMEGQMPTVDPEPSTEFLTLMKWSDKYRTMKVRTNADAPKDAAKAREFGAEGIGLCRTEHMFFEPERIHHFREMILATGDPTAKPEVREQQATEARRKSLAKLMPYQREDFVGIFKAI